VATVSGRYYAMDRDENWERTKRAYDAIVERDAEHTAPTAVEAVEESYERGDSDEFVEPTLVESEAQRAPEDERRSRGQGCPTLADGDSVLFFNFRADRARQLVRMLTDSEARRASNSSSGQRPREDTRLEWEFDISPPAIELTTMTEYDETFDFPVAFAPHEPEDTLGEVLATHGKTQLRIAESEKYPHVTYFLNGGHEVEFDGEHREIIDSPDVPTYDHQPEMSAAEVTDTAIEVIETEDPDVLVLNYANADMVGHTGDFAAAVAAVEAVDSQLARLVETCRGAGSDVLVTADHGNADDMGTEANPDTTHTTNPVPIIYLAADGDDGDERIRDGGELSDLAPTVLERCGIDVPEAMTGRSLLE
jgi:2,3-bisphosphoglycerate-independent phosphoglycerate mutase